MQAVRPSCLERKAEVFSLPTLRGGAGGHRSALLLEGIGLTFSQHSLLHFLPHEWVTSAAVSPCCTLSYIAHCLYCVAPLVAEGDTSE